MKQMSKLLNLKMPLKVKNVSLRTEKYFFLISCTLPFFKHGGNSIFLYKNIYISICIFFYGIARNIKEIAGLSFKLQTTKFLQDTQ